ncbi:MAG: hypothetical protein SGPRY_004936 [Prymnesium sp.]
MITPFLPAEAASRGVSQPAVGLIFAAMPVAASCTTLLLPRLLLKMDCTRLLRSLVITHALLALALATSFSIRHPALFAAAATALRLAHGAALAALEITLHSSDAPPLLLSLLLASLHLPLFGLRAMVGDEVAPISIMQHCLRMLATTSGPALGATLYQQTEGGFSFRLLAMPGTWCLLLQQLLPQQPRPPPQCKKDLPPWRQATCVSAAIAQLVPTWERALTTPPRGATLIEVGVLLMLSSAALSTAVRTALASRVDEVYLYVGGLLAACFGYAALAPTPPFHFLPATLASTGAAFMLADRLIMPSDRRLCSGRVLCHFTNESQPKPMCRSCDVTLRTCSFSSLILS